ncbi:unnamed protein product [Heterobilharzia americana]|nr:unnamed protein product [Heterobilharzia americana]
MLERPLYISALLILMTVCVTQYLSFPWEFVTSLFWERYPNPYAKHVLSEDVLERRFLPDGKLYTKRLVIKISKRIPKFMLRFIPKGQVPVVEESIIDVKAKRIDVVSENFGSSKKYLSVKEYCSLVPSEDDHSATQFARILIPGFSLKGFLRSAVMKAAHSYYNSSSKDTYMGYMHICKMYSNTCHSQKSNLQANDVPRSSVRAGGTREFTSSKLP